MKINISLFVVLMLMFSSCAKSPWEKYEAPIDKSISEPEPEPEPEPDPEPNENSLKIISLGINNKNADYIAIEQLITSENADLVVLREVDVNNTRTGIDINQAELIAGRVGMQYVFAPQLDNYNQGQFGLAVLSKFPINEFWVTKLPVGPVLKGDERPFAFIKINYMDDKELVFIGVHTDDGSNENRRIENRPIQAAAIVDHIKNIDLPVIVAGNFFFQNQGPDAMSPILTAELTSPCFPCETNVSQHGQEFISDHILYKNIPSSYLINYRFGETISSRRPLIAEFDFSAEAVD